MAPRPQGTPGRGGSCLHQAHQPLLLRRLAAAQDPAPQASHSRAEGRTSPPVRLLSLPPNKPPYSTGVILAGGRSRRMGRDKLPLKVGDAALLDRVHGALASCCGEIILVGAKG